MTFFPFPSDQIFYTLVFPPGAVSASPVTIAPVLDLSSEVPSLDTAPAWPGQQWGCWKGCFPCPADSASLHSCPHTGFLTPMGFCWILAILQLVWAATTFSEELPLIWSFTSLTFQVILFSFLFVSFCFFSFHQNKELSISPHWTGHWLLHTFIPVHLVEDRPENFLQSLLLQIQTTWLSKDMLFHQMTSSLMFKISDDKNSFISLREDQIKSACSLSSSLLPLCFLSVTLNTWQLVAGCCLHWSLRLGYHATLSNMLQQAVM